MLPNGFPLFVLAALFVVMGIKSRICLRRQPKGYALTIVCVLCTALLWLVTIYGKSARHGFLFWPFMLSGFSVGVIISELILSFVKLYHFIKDMGGGKK